MVGLEQKGFNIMLHLVLSFLCFVGASNIYTEFVPWQSFRIFY